MSECNHKYEPWDIKDEDSELYCIKCGMFEREQPRQLVPCNCCAPVDGEKIPNDDKTKEMVMCGNCRGLLRFEIGREHE